LCHGDIDRKSITYIVRFRPYGKLYGILNKHPETGIL